MKISKAGAWVGASVLAVASQAMGQQAVEWKVTEGGNGHWYRLITASSISWNTANQQALALKGHLCTITSQQESNWVWGALASNPNGWRTVQNFAGPHIGGQRNATSQWTWVTGEPWVYENGGSCFNSDPVGETKLHFGCDRFENKWNDVNEADPNAGGFIVEWSADCNGDGLVDYGQILSGELTDANGNGVPDCCENGNACTPSLTVNSGFESGSPLNACASESVSAGNLVASGWQVTAGTVDRIRGDSACATSTQPKFGDYCLDLCGTPASSGAIKQLVPTVPGHKYRCTFWLSGDASAGPTAKKVHAKVGDYIDLSYTFNCSGSGAQTWVMNQFEFTARGANEALAFVADNGVTAGGPMLDSINLVDITTQCVGDLDVSGQVDGADIALLLLNFGDCPVGP